MARVKVRWLSPAVQKAALTASLLLTASGAATWRHPSTLTRWTLMVAVGLSVFVAVGLLHGRLSSDYYGWKSTRRQGSQLFVDFGINMASFGIAYACGSPSRDFCTWLAVYLDVFGVATVVTRWGEATPRT